MENNELEALLGGSSSVTPADNKSASDDVEKRVESAVSKVKEALLERIDSIKTKHAQEIEELKAKTAPLEVLRPKQEELKDEFDSSSAEGWKDHIEKTSHSAANEAVDKIKQSQWNKAREAFLATHKDSDTTSLERLTTLAKNIGIKDEFDKDSIADALDAAWTVENRSKLREQANLAERYQAQFDQNLVDLASSGASNPVKMGMDTTDATSSDMRAYREYQRTGGELPLAKFLDLSRHV